MELNQEADMMETRTVEAGIDRNNLELYFHWINERHRIYLKRMAGEPKPWTEDPILREWKFTNVFRSLDRTTIWLMDHWITPHLGDDPALLAFNICLYRCFNFIPTAEALGFQTHWNPTAVKALLHARQDSGLKVFTSAHIVRQSYTMTSKIDSVAEHNCESLWALRHEIVATCQRTQSVEKTFALLLGVEYIGPFLAYEFCTDFTYVDSLLAHAHDRKTWANAGPGALKGLRRLWPEMKECEALGKMRWLLQIAPKHLEPHVPPLGLREVEMVACEFEKYMRTLNGKGSPRERYAGGAEEGPATEQMGFMF